MSSRYAHSQITPETRDRQARGKNYKDSDSDEATNIPRVRLGRGLKAEPFEDREKRGFAMSVLDSPEQLMMYAQSTGDSIPGQRLRFTAMLCGFEEPKNKRR